jgi:4-oxalomesaconate tautomerase
MLLRGGTSKGAYFLASDLPAEPAERDELLLRLMGSPDPRQIDGIGGGHPLTSKVAVVSPSPDPRADVDYLFLQVAVDRAVVSDRQNCGNVLAGVGAFAVERGLVPAAEGSTRVRVRMVNSASLATLTLHTPGRTVRYAGDATVAGVPRSAAPVLIEFTDTAGSATGSLLPTGQRLDRVQGLEVTCIDNGMPVVVLRAADVGRTGAESPAELEADRELAARLRDLRLEAGERMGLGDVTTATVPKICLVAPPAAGGTVATRTFIPERVHASIGVLGAVTVATAVALPGTVTAGVAGDPGPEGRVRVEHPSGVTDTVVRVDDAGHPTSSGLVSTARKLFDGIVFPYEEDHR